MGLFDFLKRNKKKELQDDYNYDAPVVAENNPASAARSINDLYAAKQEPQYIIPSQLQEEIFSVLHLYREYVVRFITMQLQGNYSPIAAYEGTDNELTGYLYIAGDTTYNLSVEEAISRMEVEFEKRLNEGVIRSYTIYYHSLFTESNKDHSVAVNDDQFRSISIKYKTVNGQAGYAAIPYYFEKDEITFKGVAGLSQEQNNAILNTQLEEGKDYFQERIMVEPEAIENEAGIQIYKVNQGSLGDMWGGFLGFDLSQSPAGKQLMMEYFAYATSREPVMQNEEAIVSELNYGNISVRGVRTTSDSTRTVFPVIKTSYNIPFETKKISEWQHIENLEAIVYGGGRDKFALSFFATDYCVNRDKYHQIEISLNRI
jgi:hypothetical protein